MKKNLLVTGLLICSFGVYSQNSNSAGEYMGSIGEKHREIMENVWDYTSSVAHGKSARKVEKRRKEVIQSVEDAQKFIRKMGDYNNDASLRDSVLSYLNISHIVLTENYSKIVDMEAVAEQSYDDMEAYLLAQKLANEKLDVAEEMMIQQQKVFAASNNINLIENNDQLAKNMKKASGVFNYYNKLYLVFFKSNKQEAYMLDAMSKSDVNAIEQNRGVLSKFSGEGLSVLDTIKSYNGDISLITATKQMLKFYKDEADVKLKTLANYFIEKEKFEKIKAAFDSKSQSSRTKADVDNFNNAVNSVNKASNDYNTVNDVLNKNRSELINNWNNVAQGFLDKNVPKKKK